MHGKLNFKVCLGMAIKRCSHLVAEVETVHSPKHP